MRTLAPIALADVMAARERIAGAVPRTPLESKILTEDWPIRKPEQRNTVILHAAAPGSAADLH